MLVVKTHEFGWFKMIKIIEKTYAPKCACKVFVKITRMLKKSCSHDPIVFKWQAMSTLKMIPHELPCYWYVLLVWLCNEHDIKVVQVLPCDMKSFPCNTLLITMLSMKSLMYDIMNCGLKSYDQFMSCVSVSFHRVLGVLVLEK